MKQCACAVLSLAFAAAAGAQSVPAIPVDVSVPFVSKTTSVTPGRVDTVYEVDLTDVRSYSFTVTVHSPLDLTALVVGITYGADLGPAGDYRPLTYTETRTNLDADPASPFHFDPLIYSGERDLGLVTFNGEPPWPWVSPYRNFQVTVDLGFTPSQHLDDMGQLRPDRFDVKAIRVGALVPEPETTGLGLAGLVTAAGLVRARRRRALNGMATCSPA